MNTFRRYGVVVLVGLVFIGTGVRAVRPLLPPVSSTDFDGFYEGGRCVLEGRNIYEDPGSEGPRGGSAVRRYLPFFAMAMAPLALLPMPVAGAIWHLISFASLAGCLVLSVRLAGRSPAAHGRELLLVAAASAPFWFDHFGRGQVALPVLCLTLAGLYLTARDRPWSGGMLVGLAAAAKVTPAIFLLYFLLKRRWTAAVGLVGGLLLACVLTLPVFGPKSAFALHRQWWLDYGLTAGSRFYEKGESFRFNNASLPAVLARLLMDVNAGRDRRPFQVNVASLSPRTVPTVAQVLQLAALAGLAAVVFSRRPNEPLRLSEIGFVLGLVALFTPIAWTFHFVCLIPALTALWTDGSRESRRWFWAAVALELTLVHPLLRAVGGLLLSNLVASLGCARLAWRERATAPPPAAF